MYRLATATMHSATDGQMQRQHYHDNNRLHSVQRSLIVISVAYICDPGLENCFEKPRFSGSFKTTFKTSKVKIFQVFRSFYFFA